MFSRLLNTVHVNVAMQLFSVVRSQIVDGMWTYRHGPIQSTVRHRRYGFWLWIYRYYRLVSFIDKDHWLIISFIDEDLRIGRVWVWMYLHIAYLIVKHWIAMASVVDDRRTVRLDIWRGFFANIVVFMLIYWSILRAKLRSCWGICFPHLVHLVHLIKFN